MTMMPSFFPAVILTFFINVLPSICEVFCLIKLHEVKTGDNRSSAVSLVIMVTYMSPALETYQIGSQAPAQAGTYARGSEVGS